MDKMITYTVTVHEDKTKRWFLNGKPHREDGPAVEYADGTKFWYLNGKFHREDGPAIEWDGGTKSWYLNGKRHREDGPAIEWPDGIGTKEYYLNDKELTEEEFNAKMKKTIVIDGVTYKLVKKL
jgi:antitoxin component YwqK of YwqJK toxin-antitoxin module